MRQVQGKLLSGMRDHVDNLRARRQRQPCGDLTTVPWLEITNCHGWPHPNRRGGRPNFTAPLAAAPEVAARRHSAADPACPPTRSHPYHSAALHPGRVAQLVEQGIENPRVGGSIPSPATMYFKTLQNPHKLRVFCLCQKRSIDPTSGAAQVIHQRQYADAPFNGGRAARVFHRCVA